MKFSRVLLPALLSLALGSVALGNTGPDSELAALIAKAEKGNAIAQYNLGLSYAEGRGTPADPVEAFVWLTFAMENGARGRALETLMTRLSPAQLEIARARLDKRRAALGFNAPGREVATTAPAEPTPTAADTPALELAARELAQARLDKQQLSNELAAAWKETDQLKADHAAERTRLERMLNQAQQAALDLGREVDGLKARAAELAAQPGAPAYPDLRERVADLEAQVAALRDAPPAFTDQRARVSELEQQLAAATARASAQPTAPAYPDLRDRVGELEGQLRAAREAGTAHEARADTLAKARAGAETELQTLRTQLTRSQQQAGNFEDEVRRARARVAELESALAAARTSSASQPAAPAYPDLRERVADLESQLAALRSASPAYPDLRARVGELEQQLAAVSARTATPAYPDLRNRVASLESELAAARAAAPAYPDLRDRVTELEQQLAVTQGPAPEGDSGELTRELEATRNRLTTALRGYTLLQQEHQELRARVDADRATLLAERDDLAARLASTEESARSAQADAARLGESLAALQRSTSTATSDLATARALNQQLQGAYAVLARENYELKARVARDPAPGAPTTPAAGRTHTVADGDSLSRISQRYYGTPARWQEIFNANRDVLDAQGTLRVGMTLRIP